MRTLVAIAVAAATVMAAIAMTAPEADAQPLGLPAGKFVVHSDNYSAGWYVDVVEGTRQWLSAECRTQLENAGAFFIVEPYSEIVLFPKAEAQRSCAELESFVFQPPPVVRLVVHSENYSAGWVLIDSTRQWVSAECRQLLETETVTQLTPFAEIAAADNVTERRTCEDLRIEFLPRPQF